jgi:hypothetical protein
MRARTGGDSRRAHRVPGVRQYLIEQEHENAWDPRTDPRTLHRDLLDPLEAGEPVTLDAWQLPGESEQIIADDGGLYAVVGSMSTTRSRWSRPSTARSACPAIDAIRSAHERGLGERGSAGASARDARSSR